MVAWSCCENVKLQLSALQWSNSTVSLSVAVVCFATAQLCCEPGDNGQEKMKDKEKGENLKKGKKRKKRERKKMESLTLCWADARCGSTRRRQQMM